ncbi:MAG: phosphotransferase [Candidatus Pacebacteria bacterium]|nr:phosphotransferase [Candidatus Paceibacterota bacterium]
MGKMEKFGSLERRPSLDTEDIADELSQKPELLGLLRQLPQQLWERHFQKLQEIERQFSQADHSALQNAQASYLVGILSQREEAIESYEIADAELKSVFERFPKGGLRATLSTLLESPEQSLGFGKTARVKSMHVEGRKDPIAVKYLLTPTAKTLSVEGEYDLGREVEMITDIEEFESEIGAGEHIRVPHPLFYYKRGKLQCYGMSQVDGVTLDLVARDEAQESTTLQRDVAQAIRERYASQENREQLLKEIDLFLRAVHRECLHGDIKQQNIMVDRTGVFYLIDFGQAVKMDTMTEKTREQFENLQEEERGQLRECIVSVLSYAKASA